MEELSLSSLARALERIGPGSDTLGPLAGEVPADGASREAWAAEAARQVWARAQVDPAFSALLGSWWRKLTGSGQGATVNRVDGDARIATLVQTGSVRNLNVHLPAAPPRPPAPQQLPSAVGVFVDRVAERATCTAVLERARFGRPAVVVLSGVGGVGKSELGRHWGHEVKDRFPGGILYADLGRLRQDGAVDLAEVLAGFLRALGVDQAWIPAGLEERQARFRTETAGRRVLVVLDDIVFPYEVEALLPAGEQSAVLAAGAARQYDLESDGAVTVPVGMLGQGDAELLLTALIGSDRAEAEPDAVQLLARRCGGLPIALRVAGQRLNRRRRSRVSDFVRELTGDLGMEALWDATCRSLSAQAALVYRLLADHPGADFSVPAAATCAALPLSEAEEAVDELLAASLLQEEGGRLSYHRLLREHARRAASAEDPRGEQRQAAWQRTLHWYGRQAERADRVALGDRLRYLAPLPDSHGPDLVAGLAPGLLLGTDTEALAWLHAERYNLLACMHTAFDLGDHESVCRLGEPLWALVMSFKPYAYWIEALSLAVAAAERLEHLLLLARFRSQLARAHWELGDLEAAHAQLAPALAAARTAGDVRAEASVLEFTGKAYLEEGRLDEAQAAFATALRINEEIGRVRGARLQLHHIGQVLVRRGSWADAVEILTRALELGTDDGVDPDPRTRARIATTLGKAHLHLGSYDRALELLGQAAEIVRRRGTPVDEAPILESLAQAADAQGDPVQARRHLTRAWEIHASTGSPRAAALRAALDG